MYEERYQMRNVVKLDLFGENGLIGSREIGIDEWYDGDHEEIDSDEYRVLHKITSIKGTQYGANNEIEEMWTTYYDHSGRLIKSERYDAQSNLIDSEEIEY